MQARYPPLATTPTYFASTFTLQPTAPNIPAFQAYYTAPEPPRDEAPSAGSLLVLHHGGGEAAAAFAVLAKEVREQSARELGVFAFDARGHGGCFSPERLYSLSPMLNSTLSPSTQARLETSRATIRLISV